MGLKVQRAPTLVLDPVIIPSKPRLEACDQPKGNQVFGSSFVSLAPLYPPLAGHLVPRPDFDCHSPPHNRPCEADQLAFEYLAYAASSRRPSHDTPGFDDLRPVCAGCADTYYQLIRTMQMTTGTVKFFNEARGFGFIEPEDGSKDAFVHISAVERAGLTGLTEGQRVEYELQEGQNGKSSAENLKLLG